MTAHRICAMVDTARYDTLDFTPPKSVAIAAEQGLRLREAHRGGMTIGEARARDLCARKNIPPETIQRMHAYFSRHEPAPSAPGWDDGGEPSADYIAWLLRGGDPGRRWADSLYRSMRLIDGRD